MSSTERPAPSLQRRLALELVLALGLILGALFLILDHLVDRELYARLDAGLLERSHTIAAFLQAHPEPAELVELGRLMPEYEVPGHTDFFEVWAADGRSQVRSPSSGGKPLSRPPRLPGPDSSVNFDLPLPDQHAGRAVAVRLTTPPGSVAHPALLVVASERAPHDKLEGRIHKLLLAGIALSFIAAVLIALLAVRRGLAPLQRFGAALAGSESGALSAPLSALDLPQELQPFSQALDEAFTRLVALVDAERRFSADVAHELRTPLAEIRASIESAQGAPADTDATRDAFNASILAVERMQRAIDALLMLARQESGLAPPAVDPLDLPPLLDDLLNALEAVARERGIHLQRRWPAHQWIRCDVGALERIVSNLVRNAIEYAPAGSDVTVTLKDSDTGLHLQVSNPAPDLNDADIAQLGQRFWRKSAAGGTATHAGLGLALSRALARNLALDLEFHLEDGQLVARLGRLPAL